MDDKLLEDSKYSIGGLIEIGRGGTEKVLDIYRSDRMISTKNIKKDNANRMDY